MTTGQPYPAISALPAKRTRPPDRFCGNGSELRWMFDDVVTPTVCVLRICRCYATQQCWATTRTRVVVSEPRGCKTRQPLLAWCLIGCRGLAAALALMARDRGEVAVLLQLLVYPILDDRTVERPNAAHPKLRLWSQSSNGFGWTSYLRGAERDVAVPARRDHLAGLAPAWIGVGDFDLFYEEDVVYAERLKAAGVPCEIEVIPGAFHGFDVVMTNSDVARSFFDSQCAALRGAFTQR
jgi:hypothetical protein